VKDFFHSDRLPHLLSGLVFLAGGVFAVVTPPFQVADEPAHFQRAYQLSGGGLIPVVQSGRTGGFMPSALAVDTMAFHDIVMKPETRLTLKTFKARLAGAHDLRAPEPEQFVDFSNTARYSPVVYLPQLPGIWIARLAGLDVFGILYAARITALITACVFLFVSLCLLRAVPRLRILFFLLYSSPMSVFVLASASSDCITIALSALVIAIAIRLMACFDPGLFYWGLGAGAALGLCKQVYFLLPLVLLVPVLKQGRAGSRRHAAMLFAAALVPWGIWSLVMGFVYSAPRTDRLVGPWLQLAHMVAHPLAVLDVFFHDLAVNFYYYKDTFIGRLGWLDVWLSTKIINQYWLLLLLSVVLALRADFAKTQGSDRRAWFLTAGNILFSSSMVYLSAYLSWTPVGSPVVEGVSGRYFIPVSFLFVALLPGVLRMNIKIWRFVAAVVILAWARAQWFSAHSLLDRYWG